MKLARWAVAVAAAAALLPAPAQAYVRSTGANNLCLWWREPTGLPVVANLSDGPTGGGCTGQTQVSDLIRNSLATWGAAKRSNDTQACTSFRFEYRGLTATKAAGFDDRAGAPNENLIAFRHGLCDGNPACGTDLEACADQIGCWPHATRSNIASSRTIAITTTSYIPSTGEIVDADMELHDHSADGIGYWFTCPAAGAYCGSRDAQPDGSCVSTDVGSIVTHEAGHMLGLDHPPVQNATMFATYVPGSVGLRTLDIDDVNGVCAAYPAGSAPVTCTGGTVPPIQEQPRDSGSGGCSTAMGGVLSMVGLAFALGRRRSR